MYTHTQLQVAKDYLNGSCLETYLEPSVDFKHYKLIVHTAMVYGSILAFKFGFSDN